MRPTTLTISRLSMSLQQCLRNDHFKVWFTKNGVRYVVVTLLDHEAWLANPHQLAILTAYRTILQTLMRLLK
jgi:hypothetical protein